MNDEEFLNRLTKQKLNRIRQTQFNKYIEIFNNIYKNHSLRQTCKEMNISLGCASKAVEILESIIGSKLFIRSGRAGLIPTIEAIKLNEMSNKMMDWFKNIATSFTNNNLNLDKQNIINNKQKQCKEIRIAYHQLAFGTYILPAINSIGDKSIKYSYYLKDRDDAINALLSDKLDIIMYPLEGRDIAYLQHFCHCERIGEYELCLFFNKQHEYANMNEEYFTWEDIKKINIEPQNKRSKLKTYEDVIDSNYNFHDVISTSDALSFYYGLKYNKWVVGCGKEFKYYFDCSDFKIKKVKNMRNCYTSNVNWYIIYKKDNKNLTNIVEMIKNIKAIYEEILLNE